MQALCEQLLGALGPALLLLLHLAKELTQLLITALLGVLEILLVGLGALQRMIEDADDIVSLVPRSGMLRSQLSVVALTREKRRAGPGSVPGARRLRGAGGC